MKKFKNIRLDPKVKKLVEALARHGLNPVWSCQGTSGHLCIRPTVILDAGLISLSDVQRKIRLVWKELGITASYWISAVHGYGTPQSCPQASHIGNRMYYMLQLQTGTDYLPFPIATRLVKLPRWHRHYMLT